jgi:transposase InsO family protein
MRLRGRALARRGKKRQGRGGYAYVHSAVDDYSRLAYREVLADESGPTSPAFWRRAEPFFRAHGLVVERVMTDNAFAYRGRLFNEALAENRILHAYCRPYGPQTNGKAERYNRTLLEEWAYVRAYPCEAARTRALDRWLHRYTHLRVHTAIGGPPMSRATNVPGDYS